MLIQESRSKSIKNILKNNLVITTTGNTKVASSFIYLNGEATKVCVSLEMDKNCYLEIENIIKMLELDVKDYIKENIKVTKNNTPNKKVIISVNNDTELYNNDNDLYEVPFYYRKDDDSFEI